MEPIVQGEKHILLIDPDQAFGQILEKIIGSTYTLRRVSDVETGIAQLDAKDTRDSKDIDVLLLNLDLPKAASLAQDAHALIQAASERAIPVPVIVYSWDPRRETAIDLFKHGAADLLEQPLDIRELKFALDAACRRISLARDLAAVRSMLRAPNIEGLLGNSKAMEQVHEVVNKVADVATSVLITGESGTGKGVVAQAIHRLSPRAGRPFVAFSPCALPESLIEDELFGHEKGAFTGASQARRGRFEEANGGTVFLDEIGDLALPLQTKILRVLQERTMERLGSNGAHPVDVRVICATSRNLEKMVQEGTFREDLYFRISVVRIHMPPLRERAEDIPLLAEYFLRMFAKTHAKRARSLSPGFLSALAAHKWPGNIRELQNVIERSLVLANGNVQLGVEDLPPELRGLIVPDGMTKGSFQQAVLFFKRELVRSALQMHSGNKVKAARELSISRCYLHRLLNQLNINEAAKEDEAEEGEIPPEEGASPSGSAGQAKVGSDVA